MSLDEAALHDLLAKEEIRELALLYCRGVDRKDMALLRGLYTADGIDVHGPYFNGAAGDYVDFLSSSLEHVRIGAHYVCNHLISVHGDEAEGEVYALGYHVLPDGRGGVVEDFVGVRYVDHYRVEDGRWRFARRDVQFDLAGTRPLPTPEGPAPVAQDDPSYGALLSRLFARGARA